MRIDLNGQWKLYFEPECEGMIETPDLLPGSMKCIPATVPGNVEKDLMAAGLEDDPFFDVNLYNFRKYEFYHWWFVREFDAPASLMGKKVELNFEGINTIADVFVNNILVGSAEDMMIPHTFRIEHTLKFAGENTVAVHITSAVNHARSIDIPMGASGGEHFDEFSVLRMPPSAFAWDIMPRLLSAGLWRGVSVNEVEEDFITESYYATMEANEQHARVKCFCRFKTSDPYLEGLSFKVRGVCGDSVFEKEVPTVFTSHSFIVDIPNPKLWWPHSYGQQNLYTVTMQILKDGKVLCEKQERIGIRRIEIEHKMELGEKGQFKVFCNGKFILCKGSNWVPASALHSEDASRYDKMLALFKEMGCNIVRCWGGNVVEDHRFFDLCDEYGLFVWQDFTMACATYPQERWFFDLIEKEASCIVKRYRNHPSILLWAGDNEVDERICGLKYADPANERNDVTRDILPRVIRNHDPYRKFLPSSPFIPEGFPRYLVPEQHNWGARAYFKDDFYKHSNAHFISECGYHGCPNVESLKKYIPAEKLWPYHNDAWDTHNTDYLKNAPRAYNRNQLMADQVEILTGSVPDDLETFAVLSQISQAEAKKFFVERTRILKGQRTGIIWWNMIDGWPQISDAIVDYYFSKKLAFTWLKRVHEPVCLMLDELKDWGHDVILGNDSLESHTVRWEVINGETNDILLSGETFSPANENVTLGNIRELAGAQRLYILRWTVDGKSYMNHYISGFPPYTPEKLLSWVEIIKKANITPGSFACEGAVSHRG